MGNCLQSSGGYAPGEGIVQLQRRMMRSGGEEEDEGSVLKVKMMLTKGELEWLMAQLKAGDRRLGEVLQEMARERDARAGGSGGGDGWRPSLESIVECPEMGAISFD